LLPAGSRRRSNCQVQKQQTASQLAADSRSRKRISLINLNRMQFIFIHMEGLRGCDIDTGFMGRP